MIKSQYISLQDAALMVNKSPQTIRRLIKGNRVRYRKYKTPQGFTYLVEKNNLTDYFERNDVPEESLNDEAELVEAFEPIQEQSLPPTFTAHPHPNYDIPAPAPQEYTHSNNTNYQTIITQLVQQHREDKTRLFELLEMFQKRILILEDQIKQLEAPKRTKKRWLFF